MIATVSLVEGADDLEQCGFAGSTGTDDAHYFAFVDVQVDALEHLQLSKPFGDALNGNHMFVVLSFLNRLRNQ